MEEQFKNMDRLTRKLVKEAGTHKPSPDFLNNVMAEVSAKALPNSVYRPLISKKVWWLICAVAIMSLIVIAIYPTTGISYINDFNLAEKITSANPFNNLFTEVQFSKTLIYGIGFLGLFLVQIPFLMRYMEKRFY